MLFKGISRTFHKRFGTPAWHGKEYVESVRQVNNYEENLQALDNEILRSKTAEFKAALASWRKQEVIQSDIKARAGEIAKVLSLPEVEAILKKRAAGEEINVNIEKIKQAILHKISVFVYVLDVLAEETEATINCIAQFLSDDFESKGLTKLIRDRAPLIADYMRTKEIANTIRYYHKDIAAALQGDLNKKQLLRLGTEIGIYRTARNKVKEATKSFVDTSKEEPSLEQLESIITQNAIKLAHELSQAEVKALIKLWAKDPNSIMLEVFAVVREVARRNVALRHYDVQLAGGKVLYEGKIAEMATGEGKTLVATLAAYLIHLTGRKVHIVTVNDYLAQRDAEWMGPVYEALGLSVGAIQADMDSAGDERKAQYACDITYGTNNEFGFDYLRDNMKMSLEQMVQGPLQYAIIDEVDSILIDEARTPLIISGSTSGNSDDLFEYKKADQIAQKLIALQKREGTSISTESLESDQESMTKDLIWYEKADEKIEEAKVELSKVLRKASYEEIEEDYYEVETDRKHVVLTGKGITVAEHESGTNSFYEETDYEETSNPHFIHRLEQALRAHLMFEREKDYVVMDGKVIIVDEFTGRLMHGRQWSDGLHQAVETKENVTIKEETQTLATITLQNFFKLYDQIAGMTGTAVTAAAEFMNVYDLDVVEIPLNRPLCRHDEVDVIYKTWDEKFRAIIQEICKVSDDGRPVLVGTLSVEKSEALSAALKREGIKHEVLNATQVTGHTDEHNREARIIEQAGQQYSKRDGHVCGNVTISTNMAGRGTDIKLGDGVAEIGGLHVIGTERHEARRIDNQLRGRCARQGDPGSTQFFLSFQDDLIRIFLPENALKALSWIGWEKDQPIYHGRISKGIEKAQKKVEERNFEIRKNLVKYDKVMDYQRNIFYSRRLQVLAGKGLKSIIQEMIDSVINKSCDKILAPYYPYECIVKWASNNFRVDVQPKKIEGLIATEIESRIKEQAEKNAKNVISETLGEYLEDYSDPRSWNITDLRKWAMSSFQVNLSPGKIKHQSPDDIEEQLTSAAVKQINRKDYSKLPEFLGDDFAFRRLIQWANAKFGIHLNISEIKDFSKDQIREALTTAVAKKYNQREIEYPVEFNMNMVYGPQGPNIYAFEALAEWANKKYNADLSVEQIQNTKPRTLHKQLLELSQSFNNGKLYEEVSGKLTETQDSVELIRWANERFEASLSIEDLSEKNKRETRIYEVGREFLRKELADLEKYVLLQIYDTAWKDHLYAMDLLKDIIFTRRFAEKDPSVEYAWEGNEAFKEMFETIEDRVTDIIFKIHLKTGARARSVWNVSQTSHDEVSQFAMAERQRAAAQAPQGEVKVKQIKLEQPKVGRNDPCPCGSGKKYKKCCGKNA